MSWGIVAAAGAAVVGGAMASNSAKKAANTQAAAADRATEVQKQISDDQIALQREQFNRAIELQEPTRQAGLTAQNRLQFLLGLSPLGAFSGGSRSGATGGTSLAPEIEQIRNRLRPQFATKTVTPGLRGADLDAAVNAEVAKRRAAGYDVSPFELDVIRQAKSAGGWSEVLREADLEAAVRAELEKGATQQAQPGQPAQAGQPAQTGSGYGSLMRDFGMADYQADPGYQFRLSEGEKAIQRAASAAGRSDSGRAYKDLMRFNQGEASQEYGNAYNRFQINRQNKLNPLQSMAGLGQTSANTMTQAGQNFASGAGNALAAYGQQAGANITGAGNARAAGIVGGANAINNGISTGWNMYQQNNMMDKLFPKSGSTPSSYRYTVPTYENPEY